MFHDFLPSYFEWWHIPFLFLAGLVGESFGALVGGGSLVTLPAILFVGVPVQSAIAINNAAALGTEAGILSETYRKVLQHKRLVILMAIPILLGGIVGTKLLLVISTRLIKYSLALAMLILLVHSYSQKDKVMPAKVGKRSYIALAGFLFLVGLYTNLIGVGEGTISKVGLMSLLGLTFIQSQGIKSTASMPTRIYSLIVTAFAGLIIWPYLLTKWCSNFIAGKYSTKLVKKIPDRHMQSILTVLSLGFIVYLVASG